MKTIFDMETGDPDDFLTLVYLLGRPDIDLIAVNVTPGGADQIGLVKWALIQFKTCIPIGAFHSPQGLQRMDIKQHGSCKDRVSKWHYDTYGWNIGFEYKTEVGWQLLSDLYTEDVTLITGAPLKNLGQLLLNDPTTKRGRLFVQGGFAGDNVVPPEYRLPKFEGMITCPTYNFNGDPKSAQRVVDSDVFLEKRFISKNVCHGVYYNKDFHEKVIEAYNKASDDNMRHALHLIKKGMSKYLIKKSEGKKFHDPLAACCAINPDIGIWEEVEIYREEGKWGSRISENSPNKIIISHDHQKFTDTFLMRPANYSVWRQDDNGHTFLVSNGLSKEEAESLQKEMEERGHKQMYYVEES